MWVFDDPRVGLVQEPFVSGADTMIDRVVATIPDADNGFVLMFSSVPFPGHQLRLDWRRTRLRDPCEAVSSRGREGRSDPDRSCADRRRRYDARQLLSVFCRSRLTL
jgi:hypothetical protein